MNFKYCQYVYQPAIQQVRHNKGGWDFHIKRYNQINFALKYKLELDIHNLKSQPEQSMTDFHFQMSLIWDQFVLMAPNWTHDANLYYQFREEFCLVQFLMALRDEFEFVWISIL